MDKTDRQEIHFIVDQLPDEGLEEARTLLRNLVQSLEQKATGPMMREKRLFSEGNWIAFTGMLQTLPEEDEALTEEEIRGLEEAQEEMKAGKGVTAKEFFKERGL